MEHSSTEKRDMSAPASLEHEKDIDDGKFGRSVVRGAGVGIPVAFVVITLAVWLILDVSFGKAVAISAWPAFLTGGFGGGFVGVVRGSK
jgi:preprotein translocase subunit SecF